MNHYPIVHINGTSREELIELRSKAYNALQESLEALAKMGPNGREPGRMERAERVHRGRCATIRAFMETEIAYLESV